MSLVFVVYFSFHIVFYCRNNKVSQFGINKYCLQLYCVSAVALLQYLSSLFCLCQYRIGLFHYWLTHSFFTLQERDTINSFQSVQSDDWVAMSNLWTNIFRIPRAVTTWAWCARVVLSDLMKLDCCFVNVSSSLTLKWSTSICCVGAKTIETQSNAVSLPHSESFSL